MIYLFSSSPATIISFLQQNNLEFMLIKKEEFSDFVKNIPAFAVEDIGISYDYGKIFPDSLLQNLKIINIHFSLLPKYRGAVPVEAAILNGDTTTGITFQWTDKIMDAGDIILQKEVEIKPEWTSGLLQAYMDSLLPDMLKSVFFGISQDLQSSKQMGGITYCYKTLLDRENAYIDFSKMTAQEVVRRVKAFNPDPYAWAKVKFQDQETTMNILNAEIYEYHTSQTASIKPLSIDWVKKRGMVIGTLFGSVLVTEMVISGKKTVKNGDIVSLKGKLTF
jgi:methionyl-tRNA formyltransferase